MGLQMVATGVFALGLAAMVMARGLPPVAYTIPDRLAVLRDSPGFGAPGVRHPADGGTAGLETLAGLQSR